MAVAVLVLQTLAVERGAPGRATEQEAAGTAVARGPRKIADALEAKHRVIDIERDHRHVVDAVRRAQRRSTTRSAPASLMPSCRI